MDRLVDKDSLNTHIQGGRVHRRTTRPYAKSRPIGELMDPLLEEAKAARAEQQEAVELQVEATAEAQIADAELNDLLRNTHAAAKMADRRDPTIGAVERVFPNGVTPVIAPTGDEQVRTARRVADEVQKIPAIAEHAPLLRDGADKLEQAETAQRSAMQRVADANVRVADIKRRIRVQLEANYGALIVEFRENRKFVERFFWQRRRSTKRTTDEDEAPLSPGLDTDAEAA